MSIKADCHLHSSFSGDSQAPMPEMMEDRRMNTATTRPLMRWVQMLTFFFPLGDSGGFQQKITPVMIVQRTMIGLKT